VSAATVSHSRADQRLVVPVVYISAMFMSVLDTTIVIVALPAIGREMHASSSGLALVTIAYLVALGVFIPASGWLGDRIGGRRALLGAVALFTLASLLCGLATSLPELIAFRFLQGVGGAVMTPVGLAMLFRVYPPAERVRVAGIVTVFVTLGPALGPILGGVFTTYLTWRLAFVVNVPFGVAALLVGALFLDAHTQPHPGRLDRGGLLLSGIGLASLLYGISTGPTDGWGSPPVVATLATGVVLLLALVRVELRTARPLVDLRLFSNRMFSAATSLYALGSVAFIGTLFLIALFMQDGLGFSAVRSGLTTFPTAIGTLISAQLVTRVLYRRLGPRRIVTVGLLLVAASTGLLALVGAGTEQWVVGLIMLGLGAGVSAVFVPSQAAAMATVDKAALGRASGMFNAGKQIGSAVGVAVLGTVLAAAGPTRAVAGRILPDLLGYHLGFLTAAAAALLAVPVALAIRDEDAAGTMKPPAGRR
jgi:EmrB/QacA subfamily drug resistance transporter